MDDDEPALCLWREKRREVEPGDLSGNLVVQLAKTTIRPVRAAHEEFVVALAGHPPRPVPVDADAIDLEDRADHLNTVLNALSVYVTAILDDTAQNVPGGLDLRQIDALLSDLASDVKGTLQHAVEGLSGRAA